jgi:chromosome partitioning protein
MNTTLVINSKGGAGKTTVAINLASYFAATNTPVALMDYDPQGSSLNWLQWRGPQAFRIHAANAAQKKATRLRSFEMYVPSETQQLIIDAPAGASGVILQQMLDRADCILIPVVPSAIDLHATENFIKHLLGTRRIREATTRVAVVANKVRRSMPAYQPLERFLHSLDLALLARLIDSDLFLKAAETGVGIFEMDVSLSISERKQFMPIVEWVEARPAPREAQTSGVVYELARGRSA